MDGGMSGAVTEQSFLPGLVSITFRQLSAREVLSLAAQNGMCGIEWGGDVHVPHGDLETAGEVARLTAEAGLQVAAYGSYYRFEDGLPGASGAGPAFAEVLETAAVLGAPAIRVWAGTRGPAQTPPAVRAALVRRARECAGAAAARGLELHLEFHAETLTETPESTEALLEEIGHPAVRTLWQPPLQMAPRERLAGLRRLKDRVANLHCNHFAQDPWPDIHPLAEGSEEWRTYLSDLAPLAKGRWVLLEHVRDHSPDAFREDAAALRALFSKPC